MKYMRSGRKIKLSVVVVVRTHRLIMTWYLTYIALADEHCYIGFTHDPYLDAELLWQWGYRAVVTAGGPLPVDIAVHVVTVSQTTLKTALTAIPVAELPPQSLYHDSPYQQLFRQQLAYQEVPHQEPAYHQLPCLRSACETSSRSVHSGRRRGEYVPFPGRSTVRERCERPICYSTCHACSEKPHSLLRQIWGVLVACYQRLGIGRPADGRDTRQLSRWGLSREMDDLLRKWLKLVERELRYHGPDGSRNIRPELVIPEFTNPTVAGLRREMGEESLGELERLLEGRLLRYDEIQLELDQRHVRYPYPLRDMLQILSLTGRLQIIPGVAAPLGGYHTCNRCGENLNLEAVDCPICGRTTCWVCLSCRNLGEIRSCRELYHVPASNRRPAINHLMAGQVGVGTGSGGRPASSPTAMRVCLPFQLTEAQRRASTELAEHVRSWLRWYCGPRGSMAGDVRRLRGNIPQLRGDLPQPRGDVFQLWDGIVQPRRDVSQSREVLIWAVCGAGKTEIAFSALAQALQVGLRVLFAVPRRDVVVELAERVQAAFPDVTLTCLYGGAPPQEDLGPLVIATTHQLLRFCRFFDMAILDEADAFPYAGSAMLHRALERATCPGGLRVCMTATPDPRMLLAARRGRLQLITVPVRHHGYPVPVPEVIRDGQQVPSRPVAWGAKGRYRPGRENRSISLSPQVKQLILKSTGEGHRLFVFVPRVWLAEAIAGVVAGMSVSGSGTGSGSGRARGGAWPDSALHWRREDRCVGKSIPDQGQNSIHKQNTLGQCCRVLWTHSGDPHRNRKRETFRRECPAVLVTTSVMERGITVSRADVLVLYAHDPLYDARTLIQMAGRSGRSGDCPTGYVWFVAARITREMRQAIAALKDINTEARRQGLLMKKQEPGSP